MATIRILATTLCLLASSAAFAEDPLPRARPEEVGLSPERLGRITDGFGQEIDQGKLQGAA